MTYTRGQSSARNDRIERRASRPLFNRTAARPRPRAHLFPGLSNNQMEKTGDKKTGGEEEILIVMDVIIWPDSDSDSEMTLEISSTSVAKPGEIKSGCEVDVLIVKDVIIWPDSDSDY